MTRAIVYLLVLLVLVAVTSGDSKRLLHRLSDRVVRTKFGRLRGTRVTFLESSLKPVERYLGLQYASLLGGKLRFMPPTSPSEYWEGVKHADKHGPACPQRTLTIEEMETAFAEPLLRYYRRYEPYVSRQAEDCLTLNIFVPATGTVKNYPVMIFIHGESFSSGTGNAYDASVLASFAEILVVTINYRLGVLGFLSTGDSVAAGNYALLDLIAGIHWVKENVAAFRGDPNKITLFGQGHGASLVNILLVSPMAKGNLFQRAIVQSGSALAPWATAFRPRRCLQQFAQHAKCGVHVGRNHTRLMSCLKNVSLDTIVSFEPHPPKYRTCFSPVSLARSGVIPRSAKALHDVSLSAFSRRPVMVGVTKYDGLPWVRKSDLFRKISDRRREQIMRTFVNNIFNYNRQNIYDELEYKYTDWGNMHDQLANTEAVINMVSDVLYVVPAIDLARYHAISGQTYFYAFGAAGADVHTNDTLGSYLGDDLVYVFGEPLIPDISPYKRVFTKSDERISKMAMTYWANFAKSGNPNGPNIYKEIAQDGKYFVGLQWPKYNEHSGAFIHLGGRLKIGYHYRNNKVAFWIRRIRRRLMESNTSDVRSNLLDNSHNMSLFDEPTSLTNYEFLLKLAPTIGPSTTQQNKEDVSNLNAIPPDVHHLDRNTQFGIRTISDPINADDARGNNSTSHLEFIAGNSSAISLKITIAIGLTLLFLNTMAFFGIYYQKKRIKELYRAKSRPVANNEDSGKFLHSTSEIESETLLRFPENSRAANPAMKRPIRMPDSPKMARHNPIMNNDISTSKTLPKMDKSRSGPTHSQYSGVSTFR